MTTKSPCVSIILPVYNVAKFLPIALDSAINQTLKDIEIICVDDCSTDGSYEIALEYAKKDSRIVVIKQDFNQGEVVAKYTGAKIARADYIGTIDPDDFAEDCMYEKMYDAIQKYNVDMVVCNYNEINEDGSFLKQTELML